MKTVKSGLLAALLLGSVGQSFAQVVAGTTNTWTGGVSTDWSDPANWSVGRVPVATDNVIIQGPSQAMFNPYVSGAVVARDLTLASGSVLYLQNTGVLSVYGNITNTNGSVVGVGRGTVALRGTIGQQIGGTTRTQFRNLVIGAGKTVTTTGPVSVERGLIVEGKLTVSPGQDFSLLSTSTGPGYVVSAGGVVDGIVTVQRYIDPSINPGLGYRHLSSPVQSTTFATLQGPGYTPIFNTGYNTAAFPPGTVPYPTVFGYDQSRIVSQANARGVSDFDKGFYSPEATDVMTPGIGYAVNLPGAANGVSGQGRVVTYTGQLNDGDLTVPTARGPQSGQGWNLLGNPYPSPLDWNRVVANPNTQNIGAALYVCKSSGQYSGTYASYVNGIGANGGTNVLPLGQAYMVYANANGQVAYTNSQRLSSDSTLLQRSAAGAPLVGSRLLLSGAGKNCEAVVSFTNGATDAFDAAYDAISVPLGALRLASLGTLGTTEELAINSLPALGNQAVAVLLSLSADAAGTYQLRQTEGTLPAGFTAFLLDSQTNAVYNLSAGTPASLSLSAGTSAPGRYALLFSLAAPLSAGQPLATIGASLYPNPATGSVFVQLGERTGAATVEITNVLGQSVLTQKLAAAATQELRLDGIRPGVYSVRLTTATGRATQRLIIK